MRNSSEPNYVQPQPLANHYLPNVIRFASPAYSGKSTFAKTLESYGTKGDSALHRERTNSVENQQNPAGPSLSLPRYHANICSWTSTNVDIGWAHINQDELGTAAECKKALEKAVKHGKNIVLGTIAHSLTS